MQSLYLILAIACDLVGGGIQPTPGQSVTVSMFDGSERISLVIRASKENTGNLSSADTIECDKLTVTAKRKDGKAGQIIEAEGRVRYWAENMYVTAETIVVDQGLDTVVFKGDSDNPVRIARKRGLGGEMSLINCQSAVYNRKTGAISCDGATRIGGTRQP